MQGGRHTPETTQFPKGCEIISDAEVSTSFGLVQGANSANIAVSRAGETLLPSLPQTHPAKFPLDRKEQTNAFIVLKPLIKSPR